MKKGSIFLGVVVLMGLLLTQVAAANVGYVDFEFLFNAHPEYETKNGELQTLAEKLTAEFYEKVEALESEDEANKLAEQYELEIEGYAEQLRIDIIASVRNYIAEVAETAGVQAVLLENSIVYGGVNLTPQVLEYMYQAYGISVPSHLRR